LFEDEEMDRGELVVRNVIPYSDVVLRGGAGKLGRPLEFGHTLGDQIGGQIEAGFVIGGFYEDRFEVGAGDRDPISGFMDSFLATRAVKPG
jgi:hypothetical protein